MGEGMAIVVGAGVVAVVGIALAWALFTLAGRLRDLEAARAAPDAAVALLQREIQAVRGEARQGQESTLQTVRQDVTQFGGQVGQQLGQLQTAVTTQLQQVTAEVNRRLQEAMGLIQSAQSAMGSSSASSLLMMIS